MARASQGRTLQYQHVRQCCHHTSNSRSCTSIFCELATLDPSLLVKKSKPDAPPSRRQSRHVPHQLPPAKPRARYGSLMDHTKKKQKIVKDSFAAVVDHLDQNPHQKKTVLGSLALAAAKDGKVLQDEHEQLQLAFDGAKRKILGMAVFDPSGVANSKAIETALGDGYAAEQERTFRRHRHCLMSKLRDICGDDTRVICNFFKDALKHLPTRRSFHLKTQQRNKCCKASAKRLKNQDTSWMQGANTTRFESCPRNAASCSTFQSRPAAGRMH